MYPYRIQDEIFGAYFSAVLEAWTITNPTFLKALTKAKNVTKYNEWLKSFQSFKYPRSKRLYFRIVVWNKRKIQSIKITTCFEL